MYYQRVASQNERIHFENIVQRDRMNYKNYNVNQNMNVNDVPIGSKMNNNFDFQKQNILSNFSNVNQINKNLSIEDNNSGINFNKQIIFSDVRSQNLIKKPNSSSSSKTKRDIVWEEKRKKKIISNNELINANHQANQNLIYRNINNSDNIQNFTKESLRNQNLNDNYSIHSRTPMSVQNNLIQNSRGITPTISENQYNNPLRMNNNNINGNICIRTPYSEQVMNLNNKPITSNSQNQNYQQSNTLNTNSYNNYNYANSKITIPVNQLNPMSPMNNYSIRSQLNNQSYRNNIQTPMQNLTQIRTPDSAYNNGNNINAAIYNNNNKFNNNDNIIYQNNNPTPIRNPQSNYGFRSQSQTPISNGMPHNIRTPDHPYLNDNFTIDQDLINNYPQYQKPSSSQSSKPFSNKMPTFGNIHADQTNNQRFGSGYLGRENRKFNFNTNNAENTNKMNNMNNNINNKRPY